MADIFISYKSQDRYWAVKIDALVRSAGYTTWWDTSLQTGERYNDRIAHELEQAKVSVVIWSARSWLSELVVAKEVPALAQEVSADGRRRLGRRVGWHPAGAAGAASRKAATNHE